MLCLRLCSHNKEQTGKPHICGIKKGRLIMAGKSQKMFHSQWFMGTVVLAVVLWIGGYVYLPAQTSTENEAKETLLKLQTQDVSEPNIPMPEVYKTLPEITEQTVAGKTEWKLFYFCRYLTSDELKQVIHEQFATLLFDKKGKEEKIPDYNVTSNPATNQLIVRCPTREDAEAVLETLNQIDVPPIQVKIDCLISEIYADFTFDRETTIAIENIFSDENIKLKPGGTAYGADVQQLIEDDEYLAAFPGASLRELIRSRMGLKIGYSSLAREFTVLIDLLESRGFLKILMNPTLEIVNGKKAIVKSTQHVPIDKMTMRSTQSDYLETKTEYEDVIDSLEITPHVFADGYIGLETSIVLGAKNTPDGVKQVPIITKKEISSEENRIRHGESLIIGGIRKTEKFGVARGVPILKDIPLIGFLFSGEDTEERAVETIFILTPTISTNGRPREEIMDEIREKHESN
jgi:type II secretory pathway component GspD/PulD (secretin)